jgi:hypothetical protein
MLFRYQLGRPQRHPLPRPLPYAPTLRERSVFGRELSIV